MMDWQNPDYSGIWEKRAATLERLRADPSILAGVKAHYSDNPVQFINDWLCTFDPRNVEIGKDALTPFILFDKQAECVEWLVSRWRGREDGLVEKSRDMGVSWICVAVSVGDIGVLAVCDGDTTNIMATAAPAMPATRRKHNMADAIYFGGVGSINQEPQQYIAFLDDGIFVVSPSQVAVLSPLVQVLTQTAIIQADTVSVTATTIDLTGRTTINGNTDVIGNLKVSGTTTTNGLSAGAGGGTATFSGTINHTGTYNLYGSFYHYNGTMVSLGRNVSGTHTHPYTSGDANTGAPNA